MMRAISVSVTIPVTTVGSVIFRTRYAAASSAGMTRRETPSPETTFTRVPLGINRSDLAVQTSEPIWTFPRIVFGSIGEITTPNSPVNPLDVVVMGRWFGATHR